ncbi:hypothetical protein BTS2_1066 [Bacillus sp. TS-2]|nr:hypothetical protein BTS2_1066 [Bacillus sp. TS-2]
MFSIEKVNEMSKPQFVKEIGHVYENSPWVAEAAWIFTGFKDIQHLKDAMKNKVITTNHQKKIQLLCAHPDLGARLEMTDASKKEQKQAGLNELTEKEYETFLRLNTSYVNKFGFPFIVAVKEHNKESVQKQMELRLENNQEQELKKALNEVCKIAGYRLDEIIKST